MSAPNIFASAEARRRFEKARRTAFFRQALGVVTRRPYLLVPFEDVRQRLNAPLQVDRGIQLIPLAKIVGSLGRARDFTRDFLPRTETTGERWRRLLMAAERFTPLPPIEVFQVGDCYFIIDGNHRVSIAHLLGATDIEAHVVELPVHTAITPDMDAAQMLRAAEREGFLNRTRLADARPDADVVVTLPGGYAALAEQIELHAQANANDRATAPPAKAAVEGRDRRAQAAGRWYDEVYRPLAEAIHGSGLAAHLPRATVADIYIRVMQHLAHLRAEYGPLVDEEVAFSDFLDQQGGSWRTRLARSLRRVTYRIHGDDTPSVVERLLDRLEEQEIERLLTEFEAEEERGASPS